MKERGGERELFEPVNLAAPLDRVRGTGPTDVFGAGGIDIHRP